MAAIGLAACLWLFDRGITAWARPFLVFGRNPLVAYVGAALSAELLSISSIRRRAFEALVGAGVAPRDASLAYALAFVAVWWALLALLDWRKIIIKL